MDAFITALTASVTADTLWSMLADAVPFIAIVVLIAFGYRLIRRLVSGVAKGQAKF